MRDEIITNIIETVKIAENGIPTSLPHIYRMNQNSTLLITAQGPLGQAK